MRAQKRYVRTMKTLKEYSREEILEMSDEEFEAVVDHTVEQLMAYLADTSAGWNEQWRAEHPDKAERLDQWKLDHPESEAARHQAGVEMRERARTSARDCLISGWADARAAHKAGKPELRWCHEVSAHEAHDWSESGRSFHCDGVDLNDEQPA